MNPNELQEELIEALQEIFKDDRFKSFTGEMIPFKFFRQTTPVVMTEEDDEEPIPYLIVHIVDGEQKTAKDSFNTVEVAVIVGLYDDEKENQGHKEVLNVIYKIYERFCKRPGLKKSSFTGKFEWSLKDDGYHPYFFGAISMEFYIPAVRREDEFS